MTTNKQRREQAREERRRLEAEQADAERRKRLIQYGAAAFFTAVVVVGVLIVVSQSGSDTGGDTTIEGADRIDAALAGLPQDGITLGDPKASVTITEYGDLQCPVCAAFADQVMPDLISNEIEPGNASIEFKNFNIIGPDSEDAAKAALAASKQGRYWQFIDLFYANQGAENSGYVTDAFLEAVAEGAGVADLDQFNADRDDPALAQQLAAVQDDAASLGLNATPSFVVDGPGGTKTLVAPTLDQLQQAIQGVG